MKSTKLTRRLSAAFALVRDGRTVADIGTDHAYLPIALIESGKCRMAYASDIGEGPLERAKQNIKSANLEHKITTVLTNGAAYFDSLADEFIIAGMGGELIYSIISDAPFLKNSDVHLVLQPMTKASYLRKMLFADGFNIEGETLVKEDGKLYVVMSVYYSGQRKKLSDLEALIGDIEGVINSGTASLAIDMLNRITHDIDNKIYGKREAGMDTAKENILRKEIQNILKRIKEENK